MEEPEVNLKDRWFAALLAFLVPGLGHAYQGRWFKAAVYSVCIIGLWFTGMQIGQWKINQAPTKRPGIPRSRTFSFLAQSGVGLPAMYAYYQAKRYNSGAGAPVDSLPPGEELTAEFSGLLEKQQGNDDIQDEVTGTLRVAAAQGSFGEPTIIGRFDGSTSTGETVEVILGEGTELGPLLRADQKRLVYAPVIEGKGQNTRRVGLLHGTIPRSFLNWFQAPLAEDEEQVLHKELGKFHELALVCTWIAGLLNLLAIWDALEGPAYGYGLVDETDEEEDESASDLVADAKETEAEPSPEVKRKAG